MSRSTTLRAALGITAVMGVLALAPASAEAQIYLGPEVAWNDDADLGIGAGVEFDLPDLYPGLSFMGDFIIFFPDGFDYWEINPNLTYDIPLENSAVLPFALAGLNIANVSSESESPGVDDGNTEVGLNLGGGIKFELGSFQPRVAARVVLGGAETFSIVAFLPFRVGS